MRVTIDYDNKNISKLIFIVRRVIWHSIRHTEKVDIRIVETKRGYHIISYGLKIGFSESLRIRKKCGDDKKRVAFDLMRKKKLKQILFTKKRVKKIR